MIGREKSLLISFEEIFLFFFYEVVECFGLCYT